MDTILHALSATAAKFPALKHLIPRTVRKEVYAWLLQRAIRHYPDRVYLREFIVADILRRGIKRVLSIGCRKYCVEVTNRLSAAGLDVWTLDIDPEAARWGARRHVIGDARRIDEIAQCYGFDCVILNGVFGFGIDSRADIERTLVALSRILRPGSLLVLGWNSDRAEAPATYDGGSFYRAGAQRITFDNSTHIYEFLERAEDPLCFDLPTRKDSAPAC